MSFEGSYTPGSWTAVTTPGRWLLIDLPVTDDRVARVWTALRSGADADGVLDVLLSQGLTSLPGFALAATTGTDVRLVVRAPARATITVREVDTSLTPRTGSWQDVVESADRVVLAAPGAPDDGFTLPVGMGITQAVRVTLDADPAEIDPISALSAGTPSSGTPEPLPAPAPPPPTEPVGMDYADLFGGTEDRQAFIDRLAAEAEAAVTEADDDADVPDPATPAGLPTAPVPAAPPPTAPAPDAEVSSSSSLTAPWNTEAAHSPDPRPPAVAEPGRSGIIDGLPWLDPGRRATPPAPEPEELAPTAPETAPPPPPSAPLPTSGPTSRAEAGDEEILTMSRDELLASLADHAIPGPSVLAVRCADGHLTPPFKDTCRICGAAVNDDNPGQVPRPALGVLQRDNGDTIVLDRDVVLGRSPQPTASRPAGQANLVRVADPGVSRSHAHIALDGWQVLVRDLGSSNGTEIHIPGREPEKLRPQEDYLLEPGTAVILAGDIRLVYEVET